MLFVLRGFIYFVYFFLSSKVLYKLYIYYTPSNIGVLLLCGLKVIIWTTH